MSPIRPENRHRYPKDWKKIRERILKRAEDKCEWCGVPNHEMIVRGDGYNWRLFRDCRIPDEDRIVRIVLTIAHLDHTPENCDEKNLAALCQRCHLRYDAPMKAKGVRSRRKAKKAIRDLFEEFSR